VDKTVELLKTLTEAHGVSGFEKEVRAVVRDYMEPLGELSQDKLGSVICRHRGDGPRVMLAAHMDEIGFMVHHIDKRGFIKFLPLGGWWDQVMLGHRVTIKGGKGDVVGLIGAKPPHIVTPKEREKLVTKDQMYIDIGASSADEVAEAGVSLGDSIVPQGDFVELAGGKTYLAKAFDDRVGCAVIIDVLRELGSRDHSNDVYGVATVMEEVGIRGATTSVRAVKPDVAIVLESGIAGDVPGIKPEQSSVKLGAGPDVSLLDARMMPNDSLRRLVQSTAADLDIPIQLSTMPRGGTDGGSIHIYGTGVPTVVISVPARHIHSHGSIIHRDDYDSCVRLVTELVTRLDEETVASLTR